MKKTKTTRYTPKQFNNDIILSNLGSTVPKVKDDNLEYDHRSYRLGSYDAYMNCAVMLGLIKGNENKKDLRAIGKAASGRVRAWLEKK